MRPLLVVALLLALLVLLGSLLGGLLLLLVLLLALVSCQGLLKNLEDFLVGDLLVRLELAQVQSRGATKLGDTILGDGLKEVSLDVVL